MDSNGGHEGATFARAGRRKRDSDKNKRELIAELRALRARVEELEASQTAAEEVEDEADSGARLVVFEPPRTHRARANESAESRLVSERQRAYAHLRRQLDFTRAITDSLGEGVCAVDHAGHITFSNPAVTRLLGWSRAELLGKAFDERLHVHESDGAADDTHGHNTGEEGGNQGGCPLLRSLDTGDTIERDDELLLRKDGQPLPVSCVTSPIISDNKVVGAAVAFRDITERRRLEDELRATLAESAARARQLETIFAAMTDAVVLYDPDGNVLLGNAAAEQLLALGDADYAQLPLSERLERIQVYDDTGEPLPDDRWPLKRILEGERLQGATSMDLRFGRPGGPDVYLNFSGAPIYDSDGNSLGAVMICRDVTERRRLERAAQDAAREAEQRAAELQAIFDAIVDGVVVYDAEGRMAHTNTTAHTMMREDLDERFNARPFTERRMLTHFRTAAGIEVDATTDPRLRVLRGEAISSASAEDIIMRNLAGQDIYLSVSGSPIRGPDGETRGAVLIYRDVTERRRLEDEAAARARQMETVFEAIADGVFVYDATGRILYSNAADRALFDPHAEGANPRMLAERRKQLTMCDDSGEPLPLDRWPTVRTLHGEVLTGADALELITVMLNGREIYMSVSGAPIRDDSGRIVGGVVVWRDVTERRQLEQRALDIAQEAERRAGQIEAFFQAIPDGVIFYDRHGHAVQLNATATQLIGLGDMSPEEYRALPTRKRQTLLRLMDMNGQPLARDELPVTRALRGELLTGATALDARMRSTSGESFTELEVSAAPVRNAKGRIIGAVSLLRDVGERRRLEQEILALARERGEIFNAMADVVMVFDTEGRPRQMNEAARRVLALDSRHGYQGRPSQERASVIQLRDEDGVELPVERWPMMRILRGQTLTDATAEDVIVRALDGRDVMLTVTGAPLRDSEGNVTGAVCICRDISERRELERRTRASLNTLLAMAEVLVLSPGAVAERVQASQHADQSTPVVRISPDSISIHPIALRLAELTRTLIHSQRTAIVSVDPDSGVITPIAFTGVSEAVMRSYWESLGAATLDDIFDEEECHRLRRGELVYRDIGKRPILNRKVFDSLNMLFAPLLAGDRFIGVLAVEAGAVLRPFSPEDEALVQALARFLALALERERLLREREEARTNEVALREANQRMDEFLSIASHELKTPVTVMNLSLHLLGASIDNARRDVAHAERRKRALLTGLKVLRRTEQQVARLNRLVDDLLDVSRIRVGRLELSLQPCRLDEIVRQAVAEQQLLHPFRSIELDIPANLRAPLLADAVRVGQVVANYLTNALKYSPEDKPVTVSVSISRGQARVAVHDEGPGLAPSEQQSIWDRFTRVERIAVQSGSGVGLGLGLYISKTLIERQGGQVGVESVPGQGATFWFTLPLD